MVAPFDNLKYSEPKILGLFEVIEPHIGERPETGGTVLASQWITKGRTQQTQGARHKRTLHELSTPRQHGGYKIVKPNALRNPPRYAPSRALSDAENALLEALKSGPRPTDELIGLVGVMNISQLAKGLNLKLEAQGQTTRAVCTVAPAVTRGRRTRIGFWTLEDIR